MLITLVKVVIKSLLPLESVQWSSKGILRIEESWQLPGIQGIVKYARRRKVQGFVIRLL